MAGGREGEGREGARAGKYPRAGTIDVLKTTSHVSHTQNSYREHILLDTEREHIENT